MDGCDYQYTTINTIAIPRYQHVNGSSGTSPLFFSHRGGRDCSSSVSTSSSSTSVLPSSSSSAAQRVSVDGASSASFSATPPLSLAPGALAGRRRENGSGSALNNTYGATASPSLSTPAASVGLSSSLCPRCRRAIYLPHHTRTASGAGTTPSNGLPEGSTSNRRSDGFHFQSRSAEEEIRRLHVDLFDYPDNLLAGQRLCLCERKISLTGSEFSKDSPKFSRLRPNDASPASCLTSMKSCLSSPFSCLSSSAFTALKASIGKLWQASLSQFEDAGVSPRSFVLLMFLCMATIASYYVHSVPIALQQELQAELLLSNAEYAMIDGVYSISALFTLVPAGYLCQKYNPVHIMLVSSVMGLFGSFCVLLAIFFRHSFSMFLGFGICSAFYEAQAVAQYIILSQFSEMTGIGLGFAIAAEQVSQSLSVVAAQMLGGALGRNASLSAAFFSSSVACLITFGACVAYMKWGVSYDQSAATATASINEERQVNVGVEEKRTGGLCTESEREQDFGRSEQDVEHSVIVLAEAEEDNFETQQLTKQRGSYTIWLASAVAIMTYMVFASINDVPTGLLKLHYGYSPRLSTHLIAFAAAVKFTTSIIYGIVADTLGNRFAVLTVVTMVQGVPFLYLSGSLPFPFLAFALVAIIQAVNENVVWAIILNNVDENDYGIQIGVITMGQYAAAAVMEYIQGRLVDQSSSYSLDLFLLSILSTLCAILCFTLQRVDGHFEKKLDLVEEQAVSRVEEDVVLASTEEDYRHHARQSKPPPASLLSISSSTASTAASTPTSMDSGTSALISPSRGAFHRRYGTFGESDEEEEEQCEDDLKPPPLRHVSISGKRARIRIDNDVAAFIRPSRQELAPSA